MSESLKAHIALLGAAIIYGANYVIAKSVMPEPISANGFIVMRVVGAGLLFWFIRFWVKEKIQRKDWLRLALCGLTGVAINQLMFFNGLQITSPLNAAIIMTSNPILVMVMASALLKNSITARKVLGVLAGALGAVGIIYLSSSGTNSISSVKGDIFILINSISYAIYLVIVKPLMSRYKAMTVISWVFFFGFCFVVPVGYNEFAAIPWPTFTSWQIFAAAFVVLGTTFLTYLFNIYALKRVQPTVASSYIYFQPLLAGIFSWVFSLVSDHNYTSDFSWLKILCALSIVFGVWMVSQKSAS
jgi:drug/metabolite transporter (DMT)-like permease